MTFENTQADLCLSRDAQSELSCSLLNSLVVDQPNVCLEQSAIQSSPRFTQLEPCQQSAIQSSPRFTQLEPCQTHANTVNMCNENSAGVNAGNASVQPVTVNQNTVSMTMMMNELNMLKREVQALKTYFHHHNKSCHRLFPQGRSKSPTACLL